MSLTDLSTLNPMATLSPEKQAFMSELCEEHLQEAAFLYEQCQYLLIQSTDPWPTARDFEKRLFLHLDALSVEKEPALNLCKSLTDSTDPGELYAVAMFFLNHHQPDLISRILDTLDPGDDPAVLAVCNALIDMAPDHRQQILEILAAHPIHIRVIAKVAAGARLNQGWQMIQSPAELPAVTLGPVLRMAGRIRETSAVSLLIRSLAHDEETVCSEAALSLLRMGERKEVMDYCRSHKKFLIALCLGGGKSEVLFLKNLAKDQPLTAEIIISLGVLGDIGMVPMLIHSLCREDLAEAAADALELISGAGIEESNFKPDPIDKKELFEDETKKLEHGKNPYPPEKEPGVTTQRPSQNPDLWRQWFDKNQARFTTETRYRNGSPFSPQCLVNNMKSKKLPRYLRQLAYEEMVIRYQKDIPFETDRPPTFQARAIEQYENWIQTLDNSYQEGQWYYAGQLLS